ncbi:MAG: uroporphyrinogen decarboxylase family protein [Promethearchaeota archaeon]
MGMKMSKAERVLAALERKPIDKYPAFLLGADFEFFYKFIKEKGIPKKKYLQYLKDKIVDFPPMNHALSVYMDFDADWYTHSAQTHYDEENRSIVDTWGAYQKVVVKDNGIPHLWYAGPSLTSKKKITEWWEKGRPRGYIDMLLPSVKKKMKTLLKSKYNEFIMFIGLSGPYECISMSIGLGQLSRYCRREPDFVKQILDRNFEVQAKGLEKLCSLKPLVIMCGDDHGFTNGLQMNIKYWRKFIKPVLKRYVEIVHNHGIKFVLHSCGNIMEVFGDYVELGMDGVDSLQPHLNDLAFLKRKYGDQIAFIGTIDDTHLLVESTPEEVRKVVTEQLKVLGKNSGYIPGATNFLLNQKVENILTMVETIHSFK